MYKILTNTNLRSVLVSISIFNTAWNFLLRMFYFKLPLWFYLKAEGIPRLFFKICIPLVLYRCLNNNMILIFLSEIGIGVTGFGMLFLFLGMLLFFDRGLLAIGNVSIMSAHLCLFSNSSTKFLPTLKISLKLCHFHWE